MIPFIFIAVFTIGITLDVKKVCLRINSQVSVDVLINLLLALSILKMVNLLGSPISNCSEKTRHKTVLRKYFAN